MPIFIPLEKVDMQKRLVYGTIGCEEVDHSGEILDYASAKVAFQKWSDDQFKASGGKSYGNVRAMHSRIAAGKVAEPLQFDDVAKKIHACAYISDDAEWQKVMDGVYTGFSPGGGYAKRETDKAMPQFKRYTPTVIELSIVDVPCQPSATFKCIKADGTEEMRKFKNFEEPGDLDQGFRAKDGRFFKAKANAKAWNKFLDEMEAARIEFEKGLPVDHPALAALKKAEEAAGKLEGEDNQNDDTDEEEEEDDEAKQKAAKKAALDEMAKADLSTEGRKKEAESGVAMPDGSYPIKTKDDLHNAVQAFGRAKNKPKTKAHIKRRAKALGATDMLPAKWGKTLGGGDLAKGFCEVARLAQIIDDLHWLQEMCEFEQEMEGDDASDLPDMLQQAVEHLCETIKAMVEEEGAELGDCMDADKTVDLPRSTAEQLVKAVGAAHKMAKHIKIIEPAAPVPPVDEELKKNLTKVTDELTKVASDSVAKDKVISELTKGLDSLTKRLEVMERQPVPPRGVLRVVDRQTERLPAPELRKETSVPASRPVKPANLSPRDSRLWDAANPINQ